MRELTRRDGTDAVLECAGTRQAIDTSIGVVREGGTIGRAGAPQCTDIPMDFGTLGRNITLTGGVAPARAYIPGLLPNLLEGHLQPGRVFDRTVTLNEVPAAISRWPAGKL